MRKEAEELLARVGKEYKGLPFGVYIHGDDCEIWNGCDCSCGLTAWRGNTEDCILRKLSSKEIV